MWRSSRKLIAAWLAFALVAMAVGTALAAGGGVLVVQWDANTADPDLAGYRVYFTTDPSVLTLAPAVARTLASTVDVGAGTTEVTLSSLDTTTIYYVAVTSLDYSGNESIFSNVANALPKATPTLLTLTPSSARQGTTNLAVTIFGDNMQAGAGVDLGPGVTVGSLDTSGVPTHVIANINVDPVAQVDSRDLIVTNPGGGNATMPAAFAVDVDPARVDINGSNRIDGGDLVEVAAVFTARSGDPGYSIQLDLDADGVIDGTDLSLLIALFGSIGPF